MVDHGIHVVHSDINDRVKLSRLDTGENVREFHLKSGGLGALNHTFYEKDIILFFELPGNEYVDLFESL